LRLTFRGAECILETDETLLKRILANLISNAVKYTDRGGVLVACRRSRWQETATLQVFDTGIGIAAAELDPIFEDFYQVSLPDAARRKQREGVGLGLGIVRRLADLLHHPIDVRSRLGRGSMFALRVPLSQEAPASRAKEAGTEDTRSLSLTGRSILVVDDEEIVVNAMTTLLAGWGARVLTAMSMAELQNALSALAAAPDFLIVDYQFEPSWTGEDVIRLVRENFRCAIPAAIMTGNVALVPQRAAQSGRVHVFAKPVSTAKLRALLHFHLVQPGPKPARPQAA
jgi:CheY-like chemotaxis protein